MVRVPSFSIFIFNFTLARGKQASRFPRKKVSRFPRKQVSRFPKKQASGFPQKKASRLQQKKTLIYKITINTARFRRFIPLWSNG